MLTNDDRRNRIPWGFLFYRLLKQLATATVLKSGKQESVKSRLQAGRVYTNAGGKLLVMPSMVPIQNMTGYIDTVCIRELGTPYMVGCLSLSTPVED